MKYSKKVVFTMKQLNVELHTFIVDELYQIKDDEFFDDVYMELEDKYGKPIIEVEDIIYSNIEDFELKEVKDVD
jgi:hypothetical protein